MTIKQIFAEQRRLAEAYNRLMATRNITIDSFEQEYQRHVKLTSKKENAKEALLISLSKSRNMKRLQREMTDTRNMLKAIQKESKEAKAAYKIAQRKSQESKTELYV